MTTNDAVRPVEPAGWIVLWDADDEGMAGDVLLPRERGANLRAQEARDEGYTNVRVLPVYSGLYLAHLQARVDSLIAEIARVTKQALESMNRSESAKQRLADANARVEALTGEVRELEDRCTMLHASANFERRRREEAERRVAELESIAEQLYQAAFFAQPFVAYAANNANEPRLAKECEQAVSEAINRYRALTQPEADHG